MLGNSIKFASFADIFASSSLFFLFFLCSPVVLLFVVVVVAVFVARGKFAKLSSPTWVAEPT